MPNVQPIPIYPHPPGPGVGGRVPPPPGMGAAGRAGVKAGEAAAERAAVEREIAVAVKDGRVTAEEAAAMKTMVELGEIAAVRQALGGATVAPGVLSRIASKIAPGKFGPKSPKVKADYERALDRVKVLRGEARAAAEADDWQTFTSKMEAANALEGQALSIAPRSRQLYMGPMLIGRKYLGLAAGIGAWKLGWLIWDFYSGKQTTFPAFILEETAQQAGSNLWGFTDKAQVEYIVANASEAEFREWVSGVEDMMAILEASWIMQVAYNNSLPMKLAGLARPSYVLFAKSTEGKIRSNRYIIQKVVNWYSKRTGTEWVREDTLSTDETFQGLNVHAYTWKKVREGLPIQPVPGFVWELRDSRDMVGEAFKSLIGSSMAVDLLIKSKNWSTAKEAFDKFKDNVAIAQALWDKLRPDLVALDEEWEQVYQALVLAQQIRIRAMEVVIASQMGDIPEEELGRLDDLSARVDKLKAQEPAEPPPR